MDELATPPGATTLKMAETEGQARRKSPVQGQSLQLRTEPELTSCEVPIRRILLVIDDEALSKDLAVQLADPGYEVVIAGSDIASLPRGGNHTVDVLVLDPNISADRGEQILEAIRAAVTDPLTKSGPPAVLLFARQRNMTLERFGIRIAFYLFEPFDATTVATCVRECLSWRFESCF